MKALNRILWLVTFVAIIGVAAAFAWLALGVAEDKRGGWVAITITLAVGIGAAISQYIVAPKIVGSPRRPFWMSWKGLATLFLACVAGAGAMSLLLPLLDPTVATEDTVVGDGDRTRAEIGEAQYSNGLISFDDWIIIEDSLVKTRKDFLDARISALAAEAVWFQAKGEVLTDEN